MNGNEDDSVSFCNTIVVSVHFYLRVQGVSFVLFSSLFVLLFAFVFFLVFCFVHVRVCVCLF
jgi:hypothetical protein